MLASRDALPTAANNGLDAVIAGHAAPDSERACRRVAVCVDASGFAEKVIPHALKVAAILGSPVTLLRVLEAGVSRGVPLDPVEWDIRLREARTEVERLAGERQAGSTRIAAEVVEGRAAEQISLWTRNHDVELTVLCTHGEGGMSEWGMGSIAQKLIDRVSGSLLIIPSTCGTADPVRYRRILVPLDGSSHAESVLPLTIRLARAEGAELILVHAAPIPDVTEIGPVESEAVELRERLVQRNERVVSEYLDRIRARFNGDLSVRTLLLRRTGVRSGLFRAITDEAPDLVVLSAHGHGRQSDVPFGSVAAYLITHAIVPLLVVRGRPTHLARHDAATIHQTPLRLAAHAQ